MKRMTQVLFLGLLLSVSSAVLAGQGRDRDDHRGYHGHHGDQRHHAQRHDRHDNRRHYVRYVRPAPGHFHHGRYCNAWHPRGYAAPVVAYGYGENGLVIVYQPGVELYLGGGR